MRSSAISSLTWSIGKTLVSHSNFLSCRLFLQKQKKMLVSFLTFKDIFLIFFHLTWQIGKISLLSLAYVFSSEFCWRLIFPSRRSFVFCNKNNCFWMRLQWRKISVFYHQFPYYLLVLSCFLLESPLLLNLDEVAMEDTCFE